MNKLTKVLRQKGIIWKWDEAKRNDFDSEAKILTVTGDFIIVMFHFLTMPTELRIYDKGLNLVGGQDLHPESKEFAVNYWHSFANNWKPSTEELPFG